MSNSSLSIAVVGSTGLVGSTLLSILENSHFPFKELHLVASHQSSGKEILFRGKKHLVENLETFDFSKSNLAFFCVGNEISEKYARIATSAGNIVIDKSSYFRNNPLVPLIVPEVNPDAIASYKEMKIIANPNCSTIPLCVALKPIYDSVGITRLNIATYQSVSGTGKEAIIELTEQTKQVINSDPIHSKVYSQQIAFNVLPHIDTFEESGYTKEEMKIVLEMKKIFNDQTIAINPTAVRVPVFCGHSAAVHLETKDKITAKAAEQLLANTVGVKLVTGQYPYPTPVKDAAGNDFVHVGRVREDISHPTGLNLWIVSDNLRKGAALNALQIADTLIKDYL